MAPSVLRCSGALWQVAGRAVGCWLLAVGCGRPLRPSDFPFGKFVNSGRGIKCYLS